MTSTVSTACTPPFGSTSTAVAKSAGRYEVDAAMTRVEIRFRFLGLPVGGAFDGVAGSLDVSPDDITATTARVCIDPASFRSNGPRRRHGRPHALDRVADSGIRFTADRMEPILESFVAHDGDRPLWALVGTLSMGGVRRRVRIAIGVVRSVDDGATLAFSGTTSLRCSDLGIPRRGGMLGDAVRVRVLGTATRQTV